MTSIRVRRGSISSLRDTSNAISGPTSHAMRPRSKTFSGVQPRRPPNSLGPSDCVQAPSRGPAKVADHIRITSLKSRQTSRGQRSAVSQVEAERPPLPNEWTEPQITIPPQALMSRIDSMPSLELDSSRSDSEHHDDDVVDHLTVIDAEISTVSNMSNALNSILILPLPIYSRKPVVALPKGTVKNSLGLSESGPSLRIGEDELDRHVEEVLSKKAEHRRTLQGVWAFLKTPIGVIAGIYGFLVVFWGAAIVFFLAKFIDFHNANTQAFWVEVSSQVENGLFTVIGVGFLPWRIIDTYRILRIWHYKRLTRWLRKKSGLPDLYDIDDLPDPEYDPNYVHVLDDKQQAELHYQQQQFMRSQTWYRPHGTPTHRAFPINYALTICILIDGNSLFQCILCGTMWGLNRYQRPAWSTGILIPASCLCGIAAALVIWKGGQKTKRTKEVEERLRRALTEQETE